MIKRTGTHIGTALLASLASTALLAQIGAPEPSDDIELPESRQTPAEQKAAAYENPDWAPPRTSWGDPELQGVYSTDDMRGIPTSRPDEYGTQESLTQEQYLERARSQQAGRERAVNEETFLRNEWGTRTFGFTSLIVEPADGQRPELTEAARARDEADTGGSTFGAGPFNDFDDFSMYDRCISLGIRSGMGALIYGNGIRIVQSPSEVSITYEMIHETRVIPLSDEPHLPDSIDQFTGDSRGYWDGDTLVVETRGFTDRTSVGGASHSTEMRTTERIRRVDPEMIEYRITVDDPQTFEEPFTVRTMWTTQPDYEVYEYSCHEGNGAVGNSLSGERTYERQVAEAIANGEPVPRRGGMEVYQAPGESADLIDINEGE